MDSCSVCCGVLLGPIVLFVLVLLRLVLSVPLWEPVLDELLEFVLLGDAAVGTRWPYCKVKQRRIVEVKRNRSSSISPTANNVTKNLNN